MELPQFLRSAGELLYGDRLMVGLANLLNVSDRSIRRWIDGQSVPAHEDWIREVVLQTVEAKIEDMESWLKASEKKRSRRMRLNKEGDVIEIKDGDKVYALLPERFIYTHTNNSDKPVHGLVTVGKVPMDLTGEYVVYKTADDGGGTGHGPHDIYPDGHHLYLERLSDGFRIDVYQTGSFTAMMGYRRPIGRAKACWEVEKI